MRLLFIILLFTIASLSAQGQKLAVQAKEAGATSSTMGSPTLLLPHINAVAHIDTLATAEQEEDKSAGQYMLIKVSFNYHALSSPDKKVPLARLEVEVPLYKEVVHVGLVIMPTAIQYTKDDSEIKVFAGLSAGIHFPLNKIIDPHNRSALSDIKPFMRGFGSMSTDDEDDPDNANKSSKRLFYAAYELGVDWTLVQVGGARFGISAFNTSQKYWNFGLVIKL